MTLRRHRSIPACAGEPLTFPLETHATAVYPRVRGGTKAASSITAIPCGLSPRARGNPDCVDPRSRSSRSIPACAGEPYSLIIAIKRSEVYPRVRGGTTTGKNSSGRPEGLSPRARGNL